MIFIGLGSSIGDAGQIFGSARAWLETQNIEIVAQSKSLKNPPLGGVAQNEFTNAVWQIRYPETRWEKINWCLLGSKRRSYLKAQKLLKLLQACEQHCGRTRSHRWADRSLDLDILVFNDLQCCCKKLKIPHPEIPNRIFVLEPWAEIVDKNFEIPKFGKLSTLLKKLQVS